MKINEIKFIFIYYRSKILRNHAYCIVKRNTKAIGGPGIIFEIDEAYFGKPKYNRGRRKKGMWFFGGVERHCKKNCFFVPVERRTASILEAVIKKYNKIKFIKTN